MHKHNAFTLVELLVVIAVLAILMGLLLPAVSGIREHAKATRTQQTAVQVATAWTVFVYDQKNFRYITDNKGSNGYNEDGFPMTAAMGDALNMNENADPGTDERDRQADRYFERSAIQTRYGILTDWGLVKADSDLNALTDKEHRIWAKLDDELLGSVDDPDDDAKKIRKPAIAWAHHPGKEDPKAMGDKPSTQHINSWGKREH